MQNGDSVEVVSFISNIQIFHGDSFDVVDDNGNCKDINADTITNGDEISCMCRDGFLSSNGGKIQGDYDSCVPCILSPFCGFEGDSCETNGDCFWDLCDYNNKCESIMVSERMRFNAFKA